MELLDTIEYITPYVKVLSKKGLGYYLLIDNILIYMNDEQSQLSVAHLTNNTGQVICLDKKSLLYWIKEGIVPANTLDYRWYYLILEKYTMYNSLNNPILVYDEIYNENPYAKMKSSEPTTFHKINDSIILPFFYGVLPVNGSDKTMINIFECDNISHIAKYIINKAKPRCTIDVYMRLLNL